MALLTSPAPLIRPRRWLCVATALLAVLFSFAPVHAQPREYQIKAVFLFNFLQFVEWPDEVFAGAKAPLRIGVLGDDPFGPALEAAVRGETVGGRPLVVVRSHRSEDLLGCHLVFISRSEARRLDAHLARLDPLPILTVSEIEGFAGQGGVIGFYSDGKKVRFEINADAARRRDLKLSSELLSLGRLIETEGNAVGGPAR